MAIRTWRRRDVEIGQVWTTDEPEAESPLLYRVVALIDEPVVVLKPLDERDGDEAEYHVIESPEFGAEWRRLDWKKAPA